MIVPSGADWVLIRQRYEETDDAVADICRETGISRRDIDNVRKKEKWRRKHPRPFPPPKAASGEPSSQCDPPPAALVPGGEAGDARPTALAIEPESEPEIEPESEPAIADAEPAAALAVAAPPPLIPRRHLATPAARRRLLGRLVAAISMKLEQLERRMTIDLADGDSATATDHERETRAIGALIDNLEKLRELEAGYAKPAGQSGSTATDLADEAERCRRELAQRLARLVDAAAKEA